MGNTVYPWQESAWQQLQQLRSRMPHALLFHGEQGVGKSDFAEKFAQSLLCEARQPDGHACGACASCGWFSQLNHPDYRRVRPETLDEGGGEAEADAGDTKKSAKAAKNPSKEIKIEQIRALADFMNISTHRSGLRVLVLYPAEALNVAASNALLKTLEEPPPGTVFLLATSNPARLLPTILSRCRKFAMPLPPKGQALDWLKRQGVDDAESWLAEQGGAPLSAQAQAQAANREDMASLLHVLAAPSLEGVLKAAEKLQKTPPPQLLAWLQRWLYDIFCYKLSGRIRYYPRFQKELAALAQRAGVPALLRAQKQVAQRRRIAEHPLSAKLFIEDMLLEYAAICD